MSLTEGTKRSAVNPWTISVLLLSLPSVIFVVLHLLYAPNTLPDFLDFVVVWSITLTGIFGGFLTLAAFVVTVVATFQKNVSGKAKLAMWAFVSLSFLACVYLAGVRP